VAALDSIAMPLGLTFGFGHGGGLLRIGSIMSTIPTQEVYECRFRLGVLLEHFLVFSVRWDTGWDFMSTQA
jgi:hypothetical protein